VLESIDIKFNIKAIIQIKICHQIQATSSKWVISLIKIKSLQSRNHRIPS